MFSHGIFGETLVSDNWVFLIEMHANMGTGIMWAYIFFNFAVVFVCTWLYLGGLRQIKDKFSASARKQKKESRREKARTEKGEVA